MKQRYSIALVGMLCVFFASCSKNNTAPIETPQPINSPKKKYLTRMVSVSTPPPTLSESATTITYDYAYDNKKRLSTATINGVVTTYTYNDQGELFSIAKGTGPDRLYTELSYGEGKLKSCASRLFKNNVVVDDKNYTYVYFNDKVSEIRFGLNYYKYYYDQNGNIAKVFNFGTPEFYSVYTYDTGKKNKFVNSLFKYPLPIDPTGDMFSPNARLTQTTEGLAQNPKNTITNTYDADGYPTTATSSSDYPSSYTYKFTYTYSTLD
jgi:hypothetical protein